MPETPDQQVTQKIATFRNKAREIRDGMRQSELQRSNKLLIRHFFSSRVFEKARRIAFYYPVKNEAGSVDIIWGSLQRGKKCFLPVLNPANHSMAFVTTGARTVLKKNWYGIPEPTGFSSLPINRFDIVLLPLLAFDASGSRIGMGGGYYDRALEIVARRQYYRTPQLIGLAFDKQKCSTIPARPWDVPLDGVFTESGFKLFTNHS